MCCAAPGALVDAQHEVGRRERRVEVEPHWDESVPGYESIAAGRHKTGATNKRYAAPGDFVEVEVRPDLCDVTSAPDRSGTAGDRIHAAGAPVDDNGRRDDWGVRGRRATSQRTGSTVVEP